MSENLQITYVRLCNQPGALSVLIDGLLLMFTIEDLSGAYADLVSKQTSRSPP